MCTKTEGHLPQNYQLMKRTQQIDQILNKGGCHRKTRWNRFGSRGTNNFKRTIVSDTILSLYHESHQAFCPLCKVGVSQILSGTSSPLQEKNPAPEDKHSTYHPVAKGDLDINEPVTLILSLHPTCADKAVASLTVLGGQDIHIPHFFSNSNQFFSFFLIFSHFLPHISSSTRKDPGYASTVCRSDSVSHTWSLPSDFVKCRTLIYKQYQRLIYSLYNSIENNGYNSIQF